MNYLDYKRIMKERGLIESPMSVDMIANAMRLQENIRTMRQRDHDSRYMMYHVSGNTPEALIEIYERQKTEYIQKAIKYAWDEKETIQKFGTIYYQQIEFLKRNPIATISGHEPQLIRKCDIGEREEIL